MMRVKEDDDRSRIWTFSAHICTLTDMSCREEERRREGRKGGRESRDEKEIGKEKSLFLRNTITTIYRKRERRKKESREEVTYLKEMG